jgi:hypothetical protein
VDLVGPLSVSEDGFTYLMTVVDRTMRWVEAVPLKGIAAVSCVEAFMSSWVSRHSHLRQRQPFFFVHLVLLL